MTGDSDAIMEAWKKPYRHGTLVIRPPQVVRNYVNQWRQQYDPVSHSYAEAHITLTQPFRNPVGDRVLSEIESLLAPERPFEISYGPLRSFLPSPVLWLEVQPADRVLALRQKLHELGLFDLSLPHTEDFVPHMTVTEGLSGTPVDEELHRMLAARIADGSFLCSKIAFIQPDDDFRFQVIREIPLGAG